MPSMAHYIQPSAEETYLSPRMPPSPMSPAEATYMPSFPETRYADEVHYLHPEEVPETHYEVPETHYEFQETHYSPVIYQASPKFSDSQHPIEATYYSSPSSLPEIHYSQPATYLVTPTPSDSRYHPPPRMPSTPKSAPRRPVEATYHPSPRIPSTPKSRPPRRPLEATMIKGTNVTIGHANMTMTNHQTNKPPEKVDALGLLRSSSSPAALLDANERFEPPRCIEGTRRNVRRKLDDWIRHDSRRGAPSSIFWLYGGVGAGKSALAQTVAEKSGNLAATFFFGADANRNDGNSLIPTLVLQLVLESFQGIRPFVEEKIVQNPDLFKKSRRTQMMDLLVNPLRQLSLKETDGAQAHTALPPHPRLIVIDGLDECSDRDIQCDLLRIIASAIPQFPYPLRFLITSRPESHITREFEHDLRKEVRYNLSDDSDADEDIRIFLDGEFAKILRKHPLRRHLPSKWPPRGSISSIVERASGHFIYASTVIRFIQSHQHRPDDRLQVILGLKQPRGKDRPYARLDSLYEIIFLQIKDSDQLENIHRAFGIMYLRTLKSGFFAWPHWTSDHDAINALLELRPGDLILLFDPLLSLVTFEKDNIRILHKSLFDYLLDPKRSGDFQLDLSLAHGTAANYILKHEDLQDIWYSEQFRDFVYHCQFPRLNNTLKDYLRSLASSKPVLTWRVSSCILESMLYFLQVIGRPDFDPSYYRQYVKKKTQCFKSIVPWSQRLKRIIPIFTSPQVIRTSAYFKRCLRLSFGVKPFDLKGVQLRDANGSGRIPIPAINTSVIKAIELEHEMFSSYVKVHRHYPDIVASFLEPSAELIHSCHFAIRAGSTVTFVMLVTYTNNGLRLSCSEYDGFLLPNEDFLEKIRNLVREHLRRTEQELDNNYTRKQWYLLWSGPPLN